MGDLTADTEVREQNSPLRGTRGHKNVGRLHIAVKQTPLMCKIQGVGDRINDRHDVYDDIATEPARRSFITVNAARSKPVGNAAILKTWLAPPQ